MKRLNRVLCVGLTPPDVARVRAELDCGDAPPELLLVDGLESLREELGKPTADLLLVEYSSHLGGGPEALRLRNEIAPAVPLIFVADSLDTEAAVAAVKAGASEIHLWSHHRRLGDTLHQVFSAIGPGTDSNRLAQLAARHAPDQFVLFAATPGGRFEIEYVNPAFVLAAKSMGVGLSEQDWRGKTLRELVALVYPFTRNLYEQTQERLLTVAMAGQAEAFEVRVDADQAERLYEHVLTPIFEESGSCSRILLCIREVMQRQLPSAAADREKLLREANLALLALARSRNFHGENLIEALREITEVSGKAVNVSRCSIWLYNALRSKIRCIDLYDATTGEHSDGMELYYGDHPSYFLAMESQRVIAAADAYNDLRTREYRQKYLEPFAITSLLDAAVRLRGELVGVICLEQVGSQRHWTTEEEVFAVALADVVSLALEASERLRVETELRASQQRLRSHLQSTPLGVVEFDEKFRVADWNPAAEAIFGYRAHEIVGQAGIQLVPEEARDQVEMVWKQLQRGHGGVRSSNRNRRKDGTLIDCEWYNTPLIDENGKVVGVASLVQDVTERLQAEHAVRESEERFALAFQHSPVAMGIARLRDRRYIAVNESWLRLTDLTHATAYGKTLQEMNFEAADHPLREQLYEQLARGISQPPRLIEVRSKSGPSLYGLISACLLTRNGEPCVLWCFEDQTELVRTRQELERLRAAKQC